MFTLISFFLFFIFSPRCDSINNNSVDLSPLIDYNDIHVLDFEPTLKTLAIMKVIENRISQVWLPKEIR